MIDKTMEIELIGGRCRDSVISYLSDDA